MEILPTQRGDVVMWRFLLFVLLALSLAKNDASAHLFARGGGTPGASDEEFVGPFASWMCVMPAAAPGNPCGAATASYGTATGDGSTDDTAALQTMLDKIGFSGSCAAGSGCVPVLYFPCGNYKITATLHLIGQLYIGLIGQDNSASGCTTTISWYGLLPSTTAASFTGTISGSTFNSSSFNNATLTVTPGTGSIHLGDIITSGTNCNGTYIAQSSGVNTYVLSGGGNCANVSSMAMTSAERAMLWTDGASRAKIDRITFDGRSGTNSGVDQGWSDVGTPFPTADEYTDDVFTNFLGAGITCGPSGGGCSEISVLRSKFLGNAAGIQTINANALQIWCWYCDLENNTYGLTSRSLSGGGDNFGGFHAFMSVFKNNTTADVSWGNTKEFAFVGNYSSGSGRFLDSGGTSGVDPTLVVGNTIVNTHHCLSVALNDKGPLLFASNTVVTSAGCTTDSVAGASATSSSGPSVGMGTGGDLLLEENTFSKGASPSGTCSTSTPGWTAGRCYEWNETIQTASPAVPTLPLIPESRSRTVYETSPSGSGTTCTAVSPCGVQTAICLAATGSSGISGGACTGTVARTRSIVHLPANTYTVCAIVPVGADIQIVGDGFNTIIQCGTSGTPTLTVHGPSKVVLRDFWVAGNIGSNIDSILIDGTDQPGAVIWADQLIGAGETTGLFSDNLSNATIEIHGNQFCTASGPCMTTTGANKLLLFAGTSVTHTDDTHSDTNAVINMSGTGTVYDIDQWNDQGGHPIATVTGSGNLTIGVGEWDTSLSPHSIVMTSFAGTGLITSAGINSNAAIGTNAGANVVAHGLNDTPAPFWVPSGSGSTQFLEGWDWVNPTLVADSCTNPSSPCPGLASLHQALNTLEITRPTQPKYGGPGITSVEMYRVNIENTRYGLHVTP